MMTNLALRSPVNHNVQQNWPVMIQPDWPGETCFIIGGGPSLRGFDPESIHGLGRVIAVNNAYQLCPWCDILYFADAQWYEWHKEHLAPFTGRIVTGCVVPRIEGARHVRIHPFPGLQKNRDEVAGNNSGYHAMNLAYHLGVKKMILLGFDADVQKDGENLHSHWHAGHPDGVEPERRAEIMNRFARGFGHLALPLEQAGIEVVNASPNSRIDCWPRLALDEAIDQVRAEARG